jgi:hypothetical protein
MVFESQKEGLMKQFVIGFIVIVLCLFMGHAALAAYGVGDHVADFTLNDAYGKSVSLYDYQGMAVCLQFWGDC